MWVTILLISEVKKRIFAQNDQIWPKIGIFGHFGPGLAGSFGALLVGWLVVVARAVSRKTPIYFMLYVQVIADWFAQDMPPHVAKQSSAILPRIMKE